MNPLDRGGFVKPICRGWSLPRSCDQFDIYDMGISQEGQYQSESLQERTVLVGV